MCFLPWLYYESSLGCWCTQLWLTWNKVLSLLQVPSRQISTSGKANVFTNIFVLVFTRTCFFLILNLCLSLSSFLSLLWFEWKNQIVTFHIYLITSRTGHGFDTFNWPGLAIKHKGHLAARAGAQPLQQHLVHMSCFGCCKLTVEISS